MHEAYSDFWAKIIDGIVNNGGSGSQRPSAPLSKPAFGGVWNSKMTTLKKSTKQDQIYVTLVQSKQLPQNRLQVRTKRIKS